MLRWIANNMYRQALFDTVSVMYLPESFNRLKNICDLQFVYKFLILRRPFQNDVYKMGYRITNLRLRYLVSVKSIPVQRNQFLALLCWMKTWMILYLLSENILSYYCCALQNKASRNNKKRLILLRIAFDGVQRMPRISARKKSWENDRSNIG